MDLITNKICTMNSKSGMDPLENELDSAITEHDEAIVYASVLSSSFIVPMVLNAVIELDVLGIIDRSGPGVQLSASEILSNIPAKFPDAASSTLDRMLNLLTTYSLLECSSCTLENGKIGRRYGLMPVGKFFVKSAPGGSLAGFLSFSHHEAILDIRHHLKDAVLEGGVPFKMAHGKSAFEYMKSDDAFSNAFNSAVSYHSTIITKHILNAYKGFEGIKTLVDVGGGRGTTLSLIISKYPNIRGINFDMPQVLKDAPDYQGIEHVGGDMFREVPAGDATILKRTCHNWSDEKCLKLLKNCHEALPENGKVILIESISSEVPSSSLVDKYVAHYDNIMFTQHEGKERSQKEFEALAKEAGFSSFNVVCFACAHWIMELHK